MLKQLIKKITFIACFLALISPSLLAKPQKIDSWYVNNQLKVMFLQAKELPMVDLKLLVKAGSSMDGNQYGLAHLTSSMLNQGTMQRDVNEISDHFTTLGALYAASTTKDYTSISLRSLTNKKTLNEALTQWLDIISSPSFPNDLIELKKKQQLTSIKFSQQQPGSIASREFYKLLYNKTVPYANPGIGTKQTVAALTRQQVLNFYQRYYSNKGATLAIVGDITKKKAQRIAAQVNNALPSNLTHKTKKWPKINPKEHTQHINFPSTQTHILLGTLGIKRGSINTFPLYVGNRILGGGWPSQLFQNIRVKQGLAYSVYSYFLPLEHQGPFLINLQTSNQTAQQALSETKTLLKKFTTQGPTDKEINEAKRYIIGNFPLRINNNSKKINYIAMIGFYNLPLDYLDNFIENINNVSKETIMQAFKQLINLNKMTLVTVGKALQ